MRRESYIAQDLARDLGFPGLTVAFWHWCDRHGLPRAFCLDGPAVERALERDRRG